MAPKISVIIPAYNCEPTISRAIDSVLEQSYQAHEIIVVDDGSTDSTADKVKAYGQRVKCLCQSNTGPSTARNNGVQSASSEWVAFLDSDDWFYPNRLALHADIISNDPDVDFIVGNFDSIDSGGKLICDSMSNTRFGRELLEKYGENATITIDTTQIGRYIREQFSDTRTLTLKREKFLKLGGFPEEFRIGEDLLFLIRLCAASSRAVVTCSPTAVYFVHDSGLIRSDRQRAQTETLQVLKSLSQEMENAPIHIKNAWSALVKKAYLNLAYYLAKQDNRIEAASSILQSFRFHPALSDIKNLISVLRK